MNEKIYKNRIVGHADIAPDQLVANPFNYRKHPKNQQHGVDAVLNSVGWVQSVIVNKNTGNLIDGHLRVELAIKRQEPTVPVVYVDLTENEEKQILLSLDPLAAMANNDKALMDQLMREIECTDAAMGELFSNVAKMNGIVPPDKNEADIRTKDNADINNAEALGEKWGVRVGQVWQLGEHRLVCGDATNPAHVEALLMGDRPNLMVTDPPYGVEYTPEWRSENLKDKSGKTKGIRREGVVLNDDVANWRAAWALFPGDVVYCWHSAIHTAAVLDSFYSQNFETRCQIIWVKNHFAISRGHYHWQHEPCFYFVRKGAKAGWVGDRKQCSTWNIAPEKGEEAEGGHSTQKPLDCMLRPIRNHDAAIVYDPFLGTGTTLIACEIANRQCLGCELNPGYVGVILERYKTVTGKEPTLYAKKATKAPR